MRSTGPLLLASLSCVVLAAACGDDGGSSDADGDITVTPDSPTVAIDAAPAIDAPAALMGLGQRCIPTMMNADCPTNAPVCAGLANGNGQAYCTPTCLTGGTATTTAQGQITSTTPAPNPAACTGAFSGSTGGATCGILLAYNPTGALTPNTAYTDIVLGCVVTCTAGACPGGMTCNTALSQTGLCEPTP